MKKLVLFFMFILLTFNIVAQEKIILAVPSLGYPISYIDEFGKPSGFFTELVQRIFQNSPYKLEYKYGTFAEHLNNNITTSNIININLNRAVDLIRSLRDISTNQFIGNEKNINIKDYFEMILLSLKPNLKIQIILVNMI